MYQRVQGALRNLRVRAGPPVGPRLIGRTREHRIFAQFELYHRDRGNLQVSIRGPKWREVRGGARFADALATNRALGATGINLVRVGERSGELAPMLKALSTLYENAGRDRMKRFLLLLEPIAILVIGTVIGVIMVAIMLAVTSMNDSVS